MPAERTPGHVQPDSTANGAGLDEPATVDLPAFPVQWDQANGVIIDVGAICS